MAREPGGGEERRIASAKEHGNGAHASGGVFIAIRDGGECMCADPPGGKDEHLWRDQFSATGSMNANLEWDGVEDVRE